MIDDGLEQFMADSGFMVAFLNAETFSKIRNWLSELMTAREHIAWLEEKVDRIKPLEEQIVSLKRSVEFYFDRRCVAMDERRKALDEAKRLEAELIEARKAAEMYRHESDANAEALSYAMRRSVELQKQVDQVPWFARL